ncbi:MAG TPA: cytidine deaminase [Pyrinomonadaceae bacterium]|nr:cytidine deaminase [Pyrinomonadaceae bacterium]
MSEGRRHTREEVIEAAWSARERAVAPFSKFRVGASVETDDGRIFTGCNIESASYGLTVCAERVAIWKAISEGARCFGLLVVAVDTENLTPPCGTCRQIIWEHCRDTTILLVNLQGQTEELQIKDLLPRAFDARYLKEISRDEVGRKK